MCAAREVSRAAFYEWLRRIPSARQRADDKLIAKIVSIHNDSKATYGSPRVHGQLRADGETCGANRVARLMQVNGIVGRAKRRFKRTTIPGPSATAVDLVKRVFGPGTIEVNRLWCSDISFIRTWEGWLYVATVIDVASRRVVGWAMADHMRTELVADALQMALDHRRPGSGLIFHSDRGCQYTSSEFTDLPMKTRSFSRCPGPGSAGTTRSRRASSQRSSANLCIGTRGRRAREHAAPSSSSSKAGTTRAGCTRRSVTCHLRITKGGAR